MRQINKCAGYEGSARIVIEISVIRRLALPVTALHEQIRIRASRKKKKKKKI